jgi:hypothetical protein
MHKYQLLLHLAAAAFGCAPLQQRPGALSDARVKAGCPIVPMSHE